MTTTQNKAVLTFLMRLIKFSTPVVLLYIFTAYIAGGRADNYYNKFTSPRQTSFVIGVSRAEQGIVPQIFNDVMLKAGKNIRLYNYAFDLGVSSYGKTYLQTIKNKLDTSSHNGLFILCVDPWSISIESERTDNDAGQDESSSFTPTNLINANSYPYPNFEYLLRHYQGGWGNILIKEFKKKTPTFLHDDGWMELSLSMDSATNALRNQRRIAMYRDVYPTKFKFSHSRFNYFKQTIKYLKNYGTLVLVRIPVSQAIYQVEQTYMPDFEDSIRAVAANEGLPYLMHADLGNNYIFTDGNHMYKESSRLFTSLLAKEMLEKKIIK